MDWSKGYSSSYYVSIVDSSSWRDIDRIDLVSGSVVKDISGLRESASIECSKGTDGIEKWIRIWRDIDQNGDYYHDAVFTGLATKPRDDIEGIIKNYSFDCYSVLKPSDNIDLLRGWYVSAGANGGEVIRQLLESSTPAPVVVEDGAPILTSTLIAEDGETNLSMIDKILLAIGWRLRISGDGTIYIEPYDEIPVMTFDPYEVDIIEPKLTIEADWFNAPNVFCAISGSTTSIVRDEEDDSPLSIQNRGREVWMTETVSYLSSNETIDQYAYRRLKEEQRVIKTAKYTRRYVPDVVPGNLIRLHYPEQGLDGDFIIESQDIDLSHEAPTDEEVISYE